MIEASRSSSSSDFFVIPSRHQNYETKRHPPAVRRSSLSSFGSWSSGDESSCSSFKKVAVGPLPIQHRSDGKYRRPTLLGYQSSTATTSRRSSSCSEHWSSFHKRFQTKASKKRTKWNYSIVQQQSEEGIFFKIASRMFSDCTRTMDYRKAVLSDDEWSDYYCEVEGQGQHTLHWRFWNKKNDIDNEGEECRVELTE